MSNSNVFRAKIVTFYEKVKWQKCLKGLIPTLLEQIQKGLSRDIFGFKKTIFVCINTI
jgi:hypothetical protein